MAENDFQLAMNEQLRNGHVDHVQVRFTENQRAVVLQLGDRDAAYTADELREVADGILSYAYQEGWDETPDDLAECLEACADVVDGVRDPDAVREEWSHRFAEQ